jgi:hypothetical protein
MKMPRVGRGLRAKSKGIKVGECGEQPFALATTLAYAHWGTLGDHEP